MRVSGVPGAGVAGEEGGAEVAFGEEGAACAVDVEEVRCTPSSRDGLHGGGGIESEIVDLVILRYVSGLR